MSYGSIVVRTVSPETCSAHVVLGPRSPHPRTANGSAESKRHVLERTDCGWGPGKTRPSGLNCEVDATAAD